jgi:hypothetical protein
VETGALRLPTLEVLAPSGQWIVSYGYIVGDRIVTSEYTAKALEAWLRLTNRDAHIALLALVTRETAEPTSAETTLADFAAAHLATLRTCASAAATTSQCVARSAWGAP